MTGRAEYIGSIKTLYIYLSFYSIPTFNINKLLYFVLKVINVRSVTLVKLNVSNRLWEAFYYPFPFISIPLESFIINKHY